MDEPNDLTSRPYLYRVLASVNQTDSQVYLRHSQGRR